MSYVITIFIWFMILANLLNITVLIFSRTGILYSKYNEKGEIKKRVSKTGILSTVSILIGITVLFLAFDYFIFNNEEHIDFVMILFINFVLLLLLELYDALFIDLFVIGIWRPKFLKLKDYYSLDSMKTHVKIQFTKAWIIKIPLLLICSLCFYFIK